MNDSFDECVALIKTKVLRINQKYDDVIMTVSNGLTASGEIMTTSIRGHNNSVWWIKRYLNDSGIYITYVFAEDIFKILKDC